MHGVTGLGHPKGLSHWPLDAPCGGNGTLTIQVELVFRGGGSGRPGEFLLVQPCMNVGCPVPDRKPQHLTSAQPLPRRLVGCPACCRLCIPHRGVGIRYTDRAATVTIDFAWRMAFLACHVTGRGRHVVVGAGPRVATALMNSGYGVMGMRVSMEKQCRELL